MLRPSRKGAEGDQLNVQAAPYLGKQRGALFDGYYEKHRDSTLLSCRSADAVSVVFCRSDHPGVWVGLIVQGSLGKRIQQMG